MWYMAGSYGGGPPSEQVQIAVLLRTDVFRAARARAINATPGPAELFEIVKSATARHLAEHHYSSPTSPPSSRNLEKPGYICEGMRLHASARLLRRYLPMYRPRGAETLTEKREKEAGAIE